VPPHSKDEDLSGKKVGEYEILSRIGAGGMGAVYEGVQPMIGKRVAVKVLLPQLSSDAELVERFLSEARAVNAIRHRGIVDIVSFGQLPSGQHYFVMEYLDGDPFDQLIKVRSPIPPYDVLGWTEEVLDALDAAHKAGVIHRDIKPSNLFLVDTGHGRPYVKLLDFGIAKLSSFKGGPSVGEASAVVGTPDYMAPEQARAKTISGATDLYAVGCVLFELLTRERLFEGMSAVDMMFAHVQKPARAPSVVQRGIPRSVDAFVLKLLAKNPDDRHPSAVAAREELHLLLRELNEAATLPPPSAFTIRNPSSERVVGVGPSATPRPGWNEDDKGRGETWVTPSGNEVVAPDARTQLATQPILPDSGQMPAQPIQLADLFGPYGGDQERVAVEGDDVTILARAATPLALVFHELATNSAKYGALSVEEGTVALSIVDLGETMLLRWVERGGPPPKRDRKEGFGSRLVEMSVTGQLRGSWERRFEEDGLACELTVSKAAIAA
jgi:serine/threonine protein kinase